MNTVKASTILGDAYRMIGWDAQQIDARDAADARMAFGLALQEVWEQWWWPELMQCQRVQFFADWADTELPCAEGEVFYVPAADAYYLSTATVAVAPLDADDQVNAGWVKLEPDTAYELASGATYEWNPVLPIVRDGAEVGPWGPVRLVSAHDPREQRHTETFETEPTEAGEKILNLTVARPWVWSRRVTPQVDGDNAAEYDAAASYTATPLDELVWVNGVESVIAQLGTTVNGTGGLTGSGSPEGVVTAEPGAVYLDTTNNSLWIKRTGSGNTGWIQLLA